MFGKDGGRMRTRKQVIQEFFQLLKPEFTALGFKRKGQAYYRIVNGQIWQTLDLQCHSFGGDFTINLSIDPICIWKKEDRLYGSSFRIGNLINGRDVWWSYNCDMNEVTIIFKKDREIIFGLWVFDYYLK